MPRYQSAAPKRQFIAGASCPKCGAVDTVVHVQTAGAAGSEEYMMCVACQHTENNPLSKNQQHGQRIDMVQKH